MDSSSSGPSPTQGPRPVDTVATAAGAAVPEDEGEMAPEPEEVVCLPNPVELMEDGRWTPASIPDAEPEVCIVDAPEEVEDLVVRVEPSASSRSSSSSVSPDDPGSPRKWSEGSHPSWMAGLSLTSTTYGKDEDGEHPSSTPNGGGGRARRGVGGGRVRFSRVGARGECKRPNGAIR